MSDDQGQAEIDSHAKAIEGWNTRADQGGEAVAAVVITLRDGPNGQVLESCRDWNLSAGEHKLYTHPPRATAVEDAIRELAAMFRRVAPTVIKTQETVYLYAAYQIEKTLSAGRGENVQ
jgi:hypothetical protein